MNLHFDPYLHDPSAAQFLQRIFDFFAESAGLKSAALGGKNFAEGKNDNDRPFDQSTENEQCIAGIQILTPDAPGNVGRTMLDSVAERLTSSLSDNISKASNIEETSGINEHNAIGLQHEMPHTALKNELGMELYTDGDTNSRPSGDIITCTISSKRADWTLGEALRALTTA